MKSFLTDVPAREVEARRRALAGEALEALDLAVDAEEDPCFRLSRQRRSRDCGEADAENGDEDAGTGPASRTTGVFS